ncbi:hypothetical protein [Evansella cellulosilytica]|uniref:Prokaryotic membrane lipoprotein lipid attachment site profile n=1 Tax=Evansella cellulosilytica (strain ATCC 21833 / DSM 2522 / FERM P-1141 / JCM 9156 / N-4) TaxID=649639 RepID=E6TRX4_EVAC2|nr:hypothetical protein [Evansella cellulosilytica]ADU29497.1 hypothetical protein Bcell_1232 [Evansella cellulosilytica DSM 2522]
MNLIKLSCVLMALSLFMITGCSDIRELKDGEVKEEEIIEVSIESIDAEEVLSLWEDADIFQYDGVIYMTNIDWVEELTITKNTQIGEIKTKNDANTDFDNEMSNKLPVGAIIYSVKERGDILIVEYDGEIKKYLAIVEG